MEVSRRNFPILLDNDEVFIDHLCAVVESVDELCSMEIVKKENSFSFRIAPSTVLYMEPILYEILTFINIFGIHLDLSKSMKINSTINFTIEL